jgi:flagellar motor switch protein FliN/FliY
MEKPDVRKIAFPEFDKMPDEKKSYINNLANMMDVNVELRVELGRAKKNIKDVLSMGAGSVIELDSAANSPVNLYVNDKLIAKGEICVIDDTDYAVRITEILDTKSIAL